jgi:hypothetical protein
MKMVISKGNRKMNKGFLIWNLPAIKTCPGSTAICRKECYARKAERQYPDVLPSRNRNLTASKTARFSDDMVAHIGKLITGYKSFKGFFRIHESGDFYSQVYLNSWKFIAASFPAVKFLAFTKSFNLDFSDCPKNLQIVFSVMPDSCIPPKGKPIAYAGPVVAMKKAIECPGLCDTCGLCWNLSTLKTNVHFNLH